MVEAPPELSVVVVVPEGVRGAIERWQGVLEECARRVELVVVEAGTTSAPPSRGVRRVAAPAGTTIPRLRALGLAAARGEIVAVSEGFLRPAPGWGSALLALHGDRGALAVAGSFSRAAGGAVDWALTFVEYGRLLAPGTTLERRDASFANASFRREPLLRLLGGLPDELVEPEVNARLEDAGRHYVFCEGARVFDESEASLAAALAAQARHGRFYGARRVARASLAERLLRCALSPLVAPLQLARVTRQAAAARIPGRLARAFPALVLLCCAWAVGEGVGSVAGEGASGRRWR